MRAEIICLRVDLLALGVINACEWPLNNPTNVFIYNYYRFQGIFNANVFSELAVHSESKMIIFTSGPLQGLRLFSSGNSLQTGDKEVEMTDIHQNLIRFCLDFFVLEVVCH